MKPVRSYDSSAQSLVPGDGYVRSGGSPGKGSPGSPRKANRPKNPPLIPVTVRQILDATSSGGPDATEFSIDGYTVSTVSVVGQILSMEPLSTNLNYSIDDSTATIDVRVWMEGGEGTNEFVQSTSPTWEKGRYVRAVGTIHQFKNTRSLVASKLVLIEDSNEIIYHHLEALQCHLQKTKGISVKFGGAVVQQSSSTATTTTTTTNNAPLARQSSGSDSGMTEVQQYLCDLIRQGNPLEGVTIEQLTQSMEGIADGDAVISAMQALLDEGTIFTTQDNDHYALTDTTNNPGS